MERAVHGCRGRSVCSEWKNTEEAWFIVLAFASFLQVLLILTLYTVALPSAETWINSLISSSRLNLIPAKLQGGYLGPEWACLSNVSGVWAIR